MRVLIVRIDAIGDYVLWRTCFRVLRTSPRFRNAHVTLLGNCAWKHLFETVDTNMADDAIWVNPSDYIKTSFDNLFPFVWQFKPSLIRKRQRLRDLLSGKMFDIVLLPTVSRNPFLDHLFAGIAPELWGVASSASLLTDVYYARLAPSPSPSAFVYTQNWQVLNFFIGENRTITNMEPLIDLSLRSDSQTAAIFPGASHWTRRWPIRAFAEVAQYVIDVRGLDVVVIGGPDDVTRANLLVVKTDRPGRIRSEAKKGTLMDMVKIIANAKLLISNDTCAAHFGAAQAVPTICITNGISGENMFWPYPDDMEIPFNVVTARKENKPARDLLLNHANCYLNLLHIRCSDVISAINKMV